MHGIFIEGGGGDAATWAAWDTKKRDRGMTLRRQSLGREGEARAADFLESRGYQIVARNVRIARVEIDLVVRESRALVFVEVKTRRVSGGLGRHVLAAESVDARKQARLRRGALAWLAANRKGRQTFESVRFDVITCLMEARNETTASSEEARWSFEHWRGAF